MKSRLEMLSIFTVSLLLLPAFLKANESETEKQSTINVNKIVDKANYVSYYQGNSGHADVTMNIVSADGHTRRREFTILRWDQQEPAENQERDLGMLSNSAPEFMGRQRFYIYFHRPTDWAKTVFMVHKYLSRDDDRWLYQPTLDLINRISAADKRNSFVGSHFVYEDVSGRQTILDKHELAETNNQYYILKNTPKNPKHVAFAYYKMWIHKESGVVVQTSYYNEQGKEYRRYNALEVKTIQGFKTVTKSRITDLTDNSYTEMKYKDVQYNTDIAKNVFTQRYLKKAPREYLNP